jgi:hypothetical protein
MHIREYIGDWEDLFSEDDWRRRRLRSDGADHEAEADEGSKRDCKVHVTAVWSIFVPRHFIWISSVVPRIVSLL